MSRHRNAGQRREWVTAFFALLLIEAAFLWLFIEATNR